MAAFKITIRAHVGQTQHGAPLSLRLWLSKGYTELARPVMKIETLLSTVFVTTVREGHGDSVCHGPDPLGNHQRR